MPFYCLSCHFIIEFSLCVSLPLHLACTKTMENVKAAFIHFLSVGITKRQKNHLFEYTRHQFAQKMCWFYDDTFTIPFSFSNISCLLLPDCTFPWRQITIFWEQKTIMKIKMIMLMMMIIKESGWLSEQK